jgi:hypothetical protein
MEVIITELTVSLIEVGNGFGDGGDLAHGVLLVQVLLTLLKDEMQCS